MAPQLKDFVERCRGYLVQVWAIVNAEHEEGRNTDPIPPEDPLRPLIEASLDSSTKTYHYVLPTQLLAKCVEPSLDCHSVQVSYEVPGAFDARTIAHEVVVPFDQANHRVLGGAPEPYVNNPLRVPAIIAELRDQQKARADWDKLVKVLDAVESANNPTVTEAVFKQLLYAIYQRLSGVSVTYPVPRRASLDGTMALIDQYLAGHSGGERLESISTALFHIASQNLHLYEEVKRNKVNAADAASGTVADIECWSKGAIALLVEIKDRTLTLVQLNSKLDRARAGHVSEILFIAQGGREPADETLIDGRIRSEFSAGHNVYITSFQAFARPFLTLLGEGGRAEYLAAIGEELDRVQAAIAHRKAWAELLRAL